MSLPCPVIEDLLPLYHDGVCAWESRELVEEHLRQCAHCQTILNSMTVEITLDPEVDDSKKVLEGIRSKWQRSKRIALISGIAIALTLVLLLFAHISVSWYQNTALFYVELGERMGVDPDYPHDYGPTTPEEKENTPPKYLFPKEYFLGTSDYEFWLRTPTFLDSHGSMIVVPTKVYGEITDKYGNVLSSSGKYIHLAIHFTEEKVPQYYISLENSMDDLYKLLVLDSNGNLAHKEAYQNDSDLTEDQAVLEQYREDIDQIVNAAKDVWGLE